MEYSYYSILKSVYNLDAQLEELKIEIKDFNSYRSSNDMSVYTIKQIIDNKKGNFKIKSIISKINTEMEFLKKINVVSKDTLTASILEDELSSDKLSEIKNKLNKKIMIILRKNSDKFNDSNITSYVTNTMKKEIVSPGKKAKSKFSKSMEKLGRKLHPLTNPFIKTATGAVLLGGFLAIAAGAFTAASAIGGIACLIGGTTLMIRNVPKAIKMLAGGSFTRAPLKEKNVELEKNEQELINILQKNYVRNFNINKVLEPGVSTPVEPSMNNVTKLVNRINSIGEVTLDKQQLIYDCVRDYRALSDIDKFGVSNINLLTEAKRKLDDLKFTGSLNTIRVLISKISSIGTVTLDKENLINECNRIYDGLNDIDKLAISNYLTLRKANEEFAKLKISEKGKKDTEIVENRVRKLEKLIDELSSMSNEDMNKKEGLMYQCFEKFRELNEDEKKALNNAQKLFNVSKAVFDGKLPEIENKHVAKKETPSFSDLIEAIESIKIPVTNQRQKTLIKKCNKLYNFLSDDDKKKIINYSKLVQATEELKSLINKRIVENYGELDEIRESYDISR